MSYFPHYHNTEYYHRMNIAAVNNGMLMIIQTYDKISDLSNINPLTNNVSII